jgi:hypothetical protein
MTGQPHVRATPPAAVLALPRHHRRSHSLLRLRVSHPHDCGLNLALGTPRPFEAAHARELGRPCPSVAACAVALVSSVGHAARRATLHLDERRLAAS